MSLGSPRETEVREELGLENALDEHGAVAGQINVLESLARRRENGREQGRQVQELELVVFQRDLREAQAS